MNLCPPQQTRELKPGYGLAVTSLTIGILCLLMLGFLFSIVGIVCGVLSLKTEGRNVGIAGLVACIIATIYRVIQTIMIHGLI